MSASTNPAPATSSDLARLKASATVLLGLILIQVVFAIVVLVNDDATMKAIHGGFGYLSLITALVATWFAWRWTKTSAAKGVFFHTLSLPILCVVQIGLADAGLTWVHVVLGVVYLAAVAGLWAMLRRRA